MGFRQVAKVDGNQAEIVAAFRRMGAYVIITSQLKNAFDLIVAYRGKVYIVEIKDGNRPPSARKLTGGELLCKNNLEAVGVPYYVIENIDQAIKLLQQ